MSRIYLSSRVSHTRKGVSITNECGALLQVLQDPFLHLPAVGGEQQVDRLVTELEVAILQILIQHLPALTFPVYENIPAH